MSAAIQYYSYPLLGTHTGLEKTLERTLRTSIDRSFYSIQIFLGSPYSVERRKVPEEDIVASMKLLQKCQLNVFVHAPYVHNLAGLKKANSLAWKGDTSVDAHVKKIIKSLEHELLITARLKTSSNATGVVLHIGAWGDGDEKSVDDGLDAVIATIDRINFPKDSILLLETMVGRGGVLGTTFEQLHKICSSVKDEAKDHLKICIDTQHVYANGLYDLRQISEIDRMFADFEKVIGSRDKLGLFHLNDSVTSLASHVDKHARIMRGQIWKMENLRYLLFKAECWLVPIVLETEVDDYEIVQNVPLYEKSSK